MRTALLLTAATALLLGACHRETSHGAKTAAAPKRRAPTVAPQQTPAEQTAGMVEAASQGKSQAPVTLKFDLVGRPVVDQPVTLALAVLPQVPAGPVVVEVTPSSGIEVAEDDRRFELPTVDAQQVYRRRISVTPTSEGVLIVHLSLSMKHDQVTDTRAFAVPLIVGPAATGGAPGAAAAGEGARDAPQSGPEAVSSAPATGPGSS